MLTSVHRDDRLTESEVQVILGAARGYSNPEIGRIRHLSPNTIKTHFARLTRKLGANNRAHAVALAIRQGYLKWEDNELLIVPGMAVPYRTWKKNPRPKLEEFDEQSQAS